MEDTDLAGAGLAAAMGVMFIVGVFVLLICAFYGYCLGRIFRKAGEPLWTGFVPIYNVYIWTKIVGRPAWWVFLLFIPLVGAVVQIFLSIDLARSYGKDEVFGVLLLWLFSIVGLPILAFSDDVYKGPSVEQPAALA